MWILLCQFMMDHMEDVLVASDFRAGTHTPDSMFSIISEEATASRCSSDAEQGIVNQASNISEESVESAGDFRPAIEDLEEAATENRDTRAESEVTNTSEPPAYTESAPSGSCCSQRRCCPNCNKSCVGKITITWIIIIAISFSLAVTLKLAVFKPYSFNSSPGDQREIHTFSTTFFCSSVEIQSTSKFNVFFLLLPPQIEGTKPHYFQDKVNIGISPGNFQYWYFYLLEGSYINLNICTKGYTENFILYIFQTEDNFQTFEDGCLGDTFPYKYTQVIRNNYSNETLNETRILINISETNDYYIVLSARNSPETVTANVGINLTRSEYSLSAIGEPLCLSQTNCFFDGAISSYGVLYTAPSDSAYNSFTQVKCLADAETYLFIFLVIPVMIGFVISVSVVLKTRGTRDLDDSSTQTSLRSNRTSRSRLYSGPPTYEELFHDEERRGSPPDGATLEPPPPYPGEMRRLSTIAEDITAENEGENTGHLSINENAINDEES